MNAQLNISQTTDKLNNLPISFIRPIPANTKEQEEAIINALREHWKLGEFRSMYYDRAKKILTFSQQPLPDNLVHRKDELVYRHLSNFLAACKEEQETVKNTITGFDEPVSQDEGVSGDEQLPPLPF